MPDSIIQGPAKLGEGVHYAVPMEVYRSQCCPGPCVSATDLIRLHERNPAYAFEYWSGNPNAAPDESTDATTLGIAAHTWILDGEAVFRARYVRKPEGMKFTTKAGIAWRDDMIAARPDAEILDWDDWASIEAMSRSVLAHPGCRAALSHGAPEVTAIVQDKETGLWLKARPDWLRKNGLAVNLKTTINAAKEAFRRQAFALNYHLSAALSVDALSALGTPATYAFAIVEKDRPHCAALRSMTGLFIEPGRIDYRAALRQFADCLSAGKWPGYAEECEDMDPPDWMHRRLEERIAAASQAPHSQEKAA